MTAKKNIYLLTSRSVTAFLRLDRKLTFYEVQTVTNPGSVGYSVSNEGSTSPIGPLSEIQGHFLNPEPK